MDRSDFSNKIDPQPGPINSGLGSRLDRSDRKSIKKMKIGGNRRNQELFKDCFLVLKLVDPVDLLKISNKIQTIKMFEL